jgi:small subunit ribosomal protein S1
MIDLSKPRDLVKKFRLPPEELERQVEEICGNVDMDALLYDGRMCHFTNLKPEDIVPGKVVAIRSNSVMVDYGGKVEAHVPYYEDGHTNEDLDVGDEINFIVTEVENSGKVNLARKNVDLIIKQRGMLETLHVGDRVTAKLIQHMKNGWLVGINGLPAILPSQQEFLVYPEGGPPELVDSLIEVEIASIEDKEVTVTRKPFATQIKKKTKANFFNSLNIGDLVEGTVKNITEFGAFIQIASGVIGLCHSSDFGPDELIVGKKTKSRVLKLDRDKNRVSLGIRQVTEPSWAEIIAKYSVDDKVFAEVKSIVPYGAFLEIEPGVSGLVHVSDLSWSDHVKHPKEILSEKETIEVVVLGIDVEKQHLSLGLKQVTSDPWETINDRYLVGSTYSGRITNKTKFGIFIELERGVEGLAHHTLESKSMVIGQDVPVSIMRIDGARKKISLALEE